MRVVGLALAVAPGLRSGGAPFQEPEDAGRAVEHQAGADERMRYVLFGPDSGAEPPRDGYKLLVVLPGEGSPEESRAFVEKIREGVLGPDYLVVQLVAPSLPERDGEAGEEAENPWPTRRFQVEGVEFASEDFVEAVIEEVEREHAVDPRFVFAFGWAASGSAVYASSLDEDSRITGAYVAMSVFKPAQLPALDAARGRAFYLLHSPDDWVPIRMAQQARDHLKRNGAKVKLVQYDGGHGWHGDVQVKIQAGIAWLERNHGRPYRKPHDGSNG